jgi:hypothetical protein
MQSLDDTKVVFTESCAATEHKSCMSKRVSRLRKESQFLLQRQLTGLTIVDESDALDDLVMVLFNQSLRAKVALVIQVRLRDPANILDEILSQTVRQRLYIIGLPQFFHHQKSCLDSLIVV